MRILILYGTSEGQTRKVAGFLAGRFSSAGHEVTLSDATSRSGPPDPADFDAVLVAARVHAGRFQRQIVGFARRHGATLDTRPNALLSVSMSAAALGPGDAARAQGYVAAFIRQTGWTPQRTVHVAGARRYLRHGLIGRWILGLVDRHRFDTQQDHEWTDWPALERFGSEFLNAAAGTTPSRPRRVASGA